MYKAWQSSPFKILRISLRCEFIDKKSCTLTPLHSLRVLTQKYFQKSPGKKLSEIHVSIFFLQLFCSQDFRQVRKPTKNLFAYKQNRLEDRDKVLKPDSQIKNIKWLNNLLEINWIWIGKSFRLFISYDKKSQTIVYFSPFNFSMNFIKQYINQ